MDDHIYRAPEPAKTKPTGFGQRLKSRLLRFRWFQKLEVYLATKPRPIRTVVYTSLVFLLLMLLMMALRLILSSDLRRLWGGGTPLPAKPVEFELNLSRYADDPEVLEIESQVGKLEQEIRDIDLKQINLSPPSLDFEINFDKK